MNRRFRRLLVPEVVQTSAMDCGPAVLKSALEGFGISASYGRLREACQTDVDGTSIDTLEGVARQLGLGAEQVMQPVDHLLLPEAESLPALLVVRLPNGLTHFVLVWRRAGPLVQVMDPAVGRRWVHARRLLEEVYVHEHRVDAAAWRVWAATDGFLRPLARRMRRLRVGREAQRLIERAVAGSGWRELARLDAAVRLVESLVESGGARRGREARGLIRALTEAEDRTIPDAYWSVRPATGPTEGEEQVSLRGAVLVRLGPTAVASPGGADPVSAELASALAEPDPRPGRELLRLVHGRGARFWTAVGLCLTLATCGVILEALLLRGVVDLGRSLALVEQRAVAAACLVGFGALLLVVELWLAGGLFALGRRSEVRLRAAFLEKLPRLHDRYLQSRPLSDMAERSHALQQLRILPRLAGQFVRAALALALTVAAIAWLAPTAAVPAAIAAALAVAVPLALLPQLQGLDLRVRTHAGALARFYLDALLGLSAVRAHAADRALRREHESLLVEWARASRRLLRAVVLLEGLQLVVGFGLAGWLLAAQAGRGGEAGAVLLLAYWGLNLPALGQEIGALVRQYPHLRSVTLRQLEPLGAPDDRPGSTVLAAEPVADERAPAGVELRFDAVAVRASGHTILDGLDLHIPAGAHVAIVGASGAGKSTLVGLLLGWHRPAAGAVRVDGALLDADRLDALRAETAWVDPAVQLWNAPLLDNLLYGTADADSVPAVVADAGLAGVIQRLPAGLQTPLGENGGLLSGGQGQRVRFGRALTRRAARLVLLDEPFRGLDREQRRALLRRSREVWHGATLLCVTHDVSETRHFERVLVVDGGRVVEDGSPAALAADPRSRYHALLDADEAVRSGLWASEWRRLTLEGGRLVSEPPVRPVVRDRREGVADAVLCREAS